MNLGGRAWRQMCLLTAVGGMLCTGSPSSALAFAEDLCQGDGRVRNCIRLSHEGPRRGDRVRAMLHARKAVVNRLGRSMVHMDATFFIAQAVGFRWDIAYWIAAYDQLTDVEVYTPFDTRGRPMTDQPQWRTAFLNGWSRRALRTAGTTYHYPVPYLPEGWTTLPPGVDGLRPNLSDVVHEGQLAHLRRWALEGVPACAGGFTEQSPDGSWFTGPACYQPDALATGSNLRGRFPLWSRFRFTLGFQAFSGPQIARYQLRGPRWRKSGRILRRSVLYDAEMQRALDQAPGRLADGSSPVPAEIARLGIYLHVLQDRISHHRCGDRSYVTGPTARGRFVYRYDQVECAQDYHAYGHFEEVGALRLPERTLTALEYTYDELEAFADLARPHHPGWFGEPARPNTRAWLVRDEHGEPGLLPGVLSVADGCRRLEAMIKAIANAGYHQMPGIVLHEDLCR